MTCKECSYLWKEEEDNFPCCHYEGDIAPCEEELDLEVEDD